MKTHTALNHLLKLLSRDSAHRAGIFAGTAVDAGVSVDNIFAVALSNSADRTCCSTCAAGNAIVINNVSHIYVPPILAYFNSIVT